MGAALVMGLLHRFVESGRRAKTDMTALSSHRAAMTSSRRLVRSTDREWLMKGRRWRGRATRRQRRLRGQHFAETTDSNGSIASSMRIYGCSNPSSRQSAWRVVVDSRWRSCLFVLAPFAPGLRRSA
jgi:hypothetical protein